MNYTMWTRMQLYTKQERDKYAGMVSWWKGGSKNYSHSHFWGHHLMKPVTPKHREIIVAKVPEHKPLSTRTRNTPDLVEFEVSRVFLWTTNKSLHLSNRKKHCILMQLVSFSQGRYNRPHLRKFQRTWNLVPGSRKPTLNRKKTTYFSLLEGRLAK